MGAAHLAGYGSNDPWPARHTRVDPLGRPSWRRAVMSHGHRPEADRHGGRHSGPGGLPRGRHASERHRGLSRRSALAFVGLLAYVAGLVMLAVLSYLLWA